jgi:L-alanine-DL-glutamate epimerase-like enolase superfamily enzyme
MHTTVNAGAPLNVSYENNDVTIEDIKITSFRRPLPGKASELMIKGQSIAPYVTDFIAIQITTDAGITGEAISAYGGLSLGHSIADRIRPFVIGRDPAYREAIWQELWSLDRLLYTTQFAIGTVDVALWDLYGKVVGAPLYKLMGAYRDKVPTYASGMTEPSPEAFAEDAVKYKERGYQGYKVHALGEPEFDVASCRAIREAVGDDYCLMIDVAGGYNQTEALRVGRALEELNFHWYEEPLRDMDIHGYKMLADKLDIPIAGVEVIPGGMYTRTEYIVDRAVDIVRSDASFCYGVGHLKKTAALCEAFGLNLEVHTNANSHIDAAHLHVIATLKNTDFFEQLVPEKFFHFEACEPIHIDSEGFAHVPQGPGLGVEIDWEFIEAHKVAEL